jgi:tetratricopeptide (TPR) repeat protein
MYLKLLFWPHPLTFDYYPYHIVLTGWLNIGVAFTLAVYIALILYAIVTIRRKKPAAYSILFFMISLLPVSNLFINTGTFMNERFVYQASAGFVTGVSGFLLCVMDHKAFQKILKNQTVRGLIFLIIILAFSVLTFARNFAWKDDFTLFLTDVKTSSNSAKSNCGAGGVLIERAVASQDENQKKKYYEQSLPYLTRATEIDPTYSDVWRKLGTASYELNHDIPAAFQYYFRAVSINAGDELAYTDIHFILAQSDRIDWKISMYEKLLKINPGRPDIHAQLGLLYGRKKKDYSASIAYFKNAVRLDPNYKEAYKGLGVAYQMTGEYEESLRWLESALKLDPYDASIYKLMGKAAQQMGDSFARAAILQNRNNN